jgi:cytochrome c-type biogenesis protein CcmE
LTPQGIADAVSLAAPRRVMAPPLFYEGQLALEAPMTPNAVKFGFAGSVVLAAVGYLAFAGMKDGVVQYHLDVGAFVANPQFQNQRVRLAGAVAEEGLVIGRGRLGATFVLSGHGQALPVAYEGVLPDLFKAGCDAVVEGKLDRPLDDGGTFKATLVMTKCASKYDSANGHGSEKRK